VLAEQGEVVIDALPGLRQVSRGLLDRYRQQVQREGQPRRFAAARVRSRPSITAALRR